MTVPVPRAEAVASTSPDEELAQRARAEVWPGFRAYDDVVLRLTEIHGETAPVADAVAAAWAARTAEVAAVTGPDAYATLATAFDHLEARGIIARMDYGCCMTCALDDVREEEAAGDARGYVFFHGEDTARLSSGRLLLAFGSLRPAEGLPLKLVAASRAAQDSFERTKAREKVWTRSSESIAGEVVRVLGREGLTVAWDGSADSRIEVDVTAWRKPLPSR